MQTALHLLVSIACLAAGAAMILYELARLRTDPPFNGPHYHVAL